MRTRASQKDLIVDYVKEFGYIIPARMVGKVYRGMMFGCDTPRRCREIRRDGYRNVYFESEPWDKNPKFEKFYIKNNPNKYE